LNSPESGVLEKTAQSSNFLVRLLNSLFNPFAREDILYPANSTSRSRAFHHAGTLAVGYGGLGLVLRKVVQAQQKSKRLKTMRKLRSFSAARNPTLSIDPNLNDEEQEKELENLGIPELPVLKAANEEGGIVDREITGRHDPAHFALAAVAAIAGGYGGWRLADYLADQDMGKKLDTRISKTRNLIDKMIFDEIERIRGPQKAAAFTAACWCLEKESDDKNRRFSDHAQEGGGSDLWGTAGKLLYPPNLAQGVMTVWWLWVAAAFALSYSAAKRFADKKDPNRVRLEELENISKERAKVREAPVLLDESSLTSFPDFSGSPKPPPPPPRSIAPVPVQGVKTKTPVDASDPYAAIL